MMTRRIAWGIVFAGLAIAGQVVIFRQLLQSIDRRIEQMDVPADVVASEIEDLRTRLGALERKAARMQRADKNKAKPSKSTSTAE